MQESKQVFKKCKRFNFSKQHYSVKYSSRVCCLAIILNVLSFFNLKLSYYLCLKTAVLKGFVEVFAFSNENSRIIRVKRTIS